MTHTILRQALWAAVRPRTALEIQEVDTEGKESGARTHRTPKLSRNPNKALREILTAAICVGLSLTTGGCFRHGLTLDDVIQNHAAAMGGKSAIESIQSIQFTLHIVDPGFEVDGVYRASRPGMMRIDVNAAGKHVFTEAFTGTRGWQWKGKGAVVEEGAEATAALRHGVESPGKLFGLHEMQSRGNRLDLTPSEWIDGRHYYVVRLTFPDRYSTSWYIDPGSWLITRRRDFRPLHVDVDPRPTTIETVFADFRSVAGVKFPFKSTDTDLQTGKVLETAQVKEITVNPPINPEIFERL